jgi:Domain of unknown function (DUF4440)
MFIVYNTINRSRFLILALINYVRVNYFFIFYFLFSVQSVVFAQSKAELSLLQSVEKLRVAMIEADKSVLESLVSDSLSYGHSSGRVEGKKQFIENIISGKSDFISIELSEQTASIIQNTAIVRHVLSAETNDNAKPGNVRLNVLQVWQKQKNKAWKLIARQAVKIQ